VSFSIVYKNRRSLVNAWHSANLIVVFHRWEFHTTETTIKVRKTAWNNVVLPQCVHNPAPMNRFTTFGKAGEIFTERLAPSMTNDLLLLQKMLKETKDRNYPGTIL
jgi:hypothetical protein